MPDGFFHLSYSYGETTQNGVRVSRALKAVHDSTCDAISERWHTRFDVRGNSLRRAPESLALISLPG